MADIVSVGNGQLVLLEQAKQALAEVKTIPEAKKIRDQAEAIRNYLRVQGASFEAQQDAAEVKVRAERRIGELLGPPDDKGGRPKKPSNDLTVSDDDDGPAREWKRRFRAEALLPEDEFEEHLARCREEDKEITSAALFKLGSRLARHKRQRERNLGDKPEPDEEGGPIPIGIVCGDALKVLKSIPAESFHLIVTDPPYNIGVDYGDGAEADQLADVDYLAWCERWLLECCRVLRPAGSFWLIIGDEYAAPLSIRLKQIGFHRRAWVKWYETFGVCNSAMTNFSRCSRHLFYCVKNPKCYTWNADAFLTVSDRQQKYHDKRANETGKILDDVWPIPRLQGTSKERIPDFPTQLPLELIRPIVQGCARPGNFILDPFAGSGTTGVAASEHGCKFLGIEKQEKFADLACRRLAKAKERRKTT
jgi:site-specific DNA-methyltransferase (adenine-specific)